MFGIRGGDDIAGIAELKLGLVTIIDRLESLYLQAKHDHTYHTDAGRLLEGTPGIMLEIWDAIITAYDEGPTDFSNGWPDRSLAEATKECIERMRSEFGPFGYASSNIVERDGVTLKPKAFNDLRLKIIEDHRPVDMPIQLDMFVEQVVKSITHFSSINPI